MIDKVIGNKCTGCTACKNACPCKAISMEADSEGFEYPGVDSQLCTKCGACLKICPSLNKSKSNIYLQPQVYAAWNMDEDIRINSTSGGVFFSLAEGVINSGGYVVGADYDAEFGIYHRVISNINDVYRLRQSKYAQSDLKNVFLEIRTLLKQGKVVLFVGSPCQSAGLQNYLGKPFENLICCDFICRGIISQKVYKKYLYDAAHGKQIESVQFKNKDFGWNQFSTKIHMENGTVYQQDRNHDPYLKGYLKHNLYMRPVCYECPYKSIPRVSDLSLGDFWGIGNFKAQLDDNKGTSVVLVNSEKGAALIEKIKDKLYLEKRELTEVTKGNVCLLHSPSEGEFRSFFFKNIDRYSFDKLISIIDEKSLHLTWKDRILRKAHQLKVFILETIS